MSGRSSPSGHDGRSLLVARSRAPARRLLLLGLVGLLSLVGLAGELRYATSGPQRWPVLGWLNVALIAGCLVVAALMRGRGTEWLLRLDTDGLTITGSPTVPWADLLEVRWTARRRWAVETLVFVPQPGRTLPILPAPILARAAAASGVRRHGSPVVLVAGQLELPLAAVATAVGQFGGVPVRTG